MELPACLLILFTVERMGRRLPFSAANIATGLACLIAAFIPESEPRFTFKLYRPFKEHTLI